MLVLVKHRETCSASAHLSNDPLFALFSPLPSLLFTPISCPNAVQKEIWLKTTAFMVVGLVVPYTAFVGYKEMTHHHHEHGPTYPHMKVRRKAFPWSANQCDFFEMQCHRDFASGAAPSHH